MLSLLEVALWLFAIVDVKEPALRVLGWEDGHFRSAKDCLHIVYNRTCVLVNNCLTRSGSWAVELLGLGDSAGTDTGGTIGDDVSSKGYVWAQILDFFH